MFDVKLAWTIICGSLADCMEFGEENQDEFTDGEDGEDQELKEAFRIVDQFMREKLKEEGYDS